MRIWDINPGYLNRQSLLGEHRELHGAVVIIRDKKKGYSNHPEMLRWVDYGWALKQRHKLLVAEMTLRGYVDRSPVLLRSKPGQWPEIFIDSPSDQMSIVKNKYVNIEKGRIPLPHNAQQLWAQHKYSVMARDISVYKKMGKKLSKKSGKKVFNQLALELTILLREAPDPRLIKNTLLHMWGYVSKFEPGTKRKIDTLSMKTLLNKIQQLSLTYNVKYLTHSCSLSELAAWDI